MKVGSLLISGLILLASGVLSLTTSGAPPLDTVQPVTVRVDSIRYTLDDDDDTVVFFGGGGRYSGGGGFGGGGK